VPRGREARQTTRGERAGLLGHVARPAPRSRLRVREPRRLPRGLEPSETAALLSSFVTVRDRAIAGLMLFCGLRSCEVLSLSVSDVDIALGWVRVLGKGDKERRVPVDREVAALIQSYVLTERPETDSRALFVVAKGPTRGRPPGCPRSFVITAHEPGCRLGTHMRCGIRLGPRSRRPALILRCCRR